MEEKTTKIRHRIHELFSEELLLGMEKVMNNPEYTNNNQKVEANLLLLKDIGATYIASGTNRMAVLISKYIYKIALDSFGVRDNWTECEMSKRAQPWVTKTYECNGLVAVAEYVNLISKEEFQDSKENIAGILEILSEDYLFCDISTTGKNWCNFGHRTNGDIVILDYGYLYPIDEKIMHCRKCGGKLVWNKNFTQLICAKCSKAHDPIEIRDRMKKKETDFAKLSHIKGPIKIKLNR